MKRVYLTAMESLLHLVPDSPATRRKKRLEREARAMEAASKAHHEQFMMEAKNKLIHLQAELEMTLTRYENPHNIH